MRSTCPKWLVLGCVSMCFVREKLFQNFTPCAGFCLDYHKSEFSSKIQVRLSLFYIFWSNIINLKCSSTCFSYFIYTFKGVHSSFPGESSHLSATLYLRGSYCLSFLCCFFLNLGCNVIFWSFLLSFQVLAITSHRWNPFCGFRALVHTHEQHTAFTRSPPTSSNANRS